MKRSAMKLAFIITFVFLIAGCGGQGSGVHSESDRHGNDSVLSQNLSYEFQELNYNGAVKCSTKKRSFQSMSDLCIGLSQRTENNQCGFDLRAKYFAEIRCPGQFEETSFWMSSERLIPESNGLCRIKYQGVNPIERRSDYCIELLKLYREFQCGRQTLEADYIESKCAKNFPAE